MLLRSLNIKGFRRFRQLAVEGLGDVTLVTGRNNVGKTVLLEAVHALAARGSAISLADILVRHDEYERRSREEIDRPAKGSEPLDFRALFHTRPIEITRQTTLFLGTTDDPERLKISVQATRKQRDAERQIMLELDESEQPGPLSLVVKYADDPVQIMALDLLSTNPTRGTNRASMRLPPFVPARGLAPLRVAAWWDQVSLTDAEPRVIACLQLAAPVEKIALVENGSGVRIVLVRLRGESDPVPLRALGDAMSRMLSFSLALEQARESGVLLIDELENGIHYTVLPELWRFMFRAARASNVQIFATTHSWDCIAAFAGVAVAEHDSAGVLVRLQQKNGDVLATTFERDDLRIIERDAIEVR